MNRTRWPLVLIVEDDPGVAGMLRDALSDARYRVVVAEDGDEALTECAIEEPDVILLDIKLKHMDGDQFLTRYRRRRSAKAKIIVVSGLLGLDRLMLPVDDIVGKPFDLGDVLSRVQRAAALRADEPRELADSP